jgi:hypothetical protein
MGIAELRVGAVGCRAVRVTLAGGVVPGELVLRPRDGSGNVLLRSGEVRVRVLLGRTVTGGLVAAGIMPDGRLTRSATVL